MSTFIFPPRWRLVLLGVAIALVLGGCSYDSTLEPKPTATATAIAFGPTDIAVGSLLSDASAAWDGVEAWTVETRTETSSDGSSATTSVARETVLLPNDRHVVTTNGDTVVAEEIATGGTIYMRGTLVTSSIYPEVDADTWISFTPDQAPADTALAERVAYLTTPPAFPFATFSAETRALPAKPAGEIEVDDRVCLVYHFTTTSPEREGIDYRIAFDKDDHPCQIVREAGGVVETTVWHYPDSPEPIAAPKDVVVVDEFPGAPQGSGMNVAS